MFGNEFQLSINIIASLTTREDLSTFMAALEAQELVEKFSSDGPYTLFAPTNAAFEAPAADVLEDDLVLYDTLLYHAIAGELSLEELASLESLTTMLGV